MDVFQDLMSRGVSDVDWKVKKKKKKKCKIVEVYLLILTSFQTRLPKES